MATSDASSGEVGELRKTINVQMRLHGYISNAVENTRKAGAASVNAHAIDTRLQLIDKYWSKFDEVHEQLESDYGGIHSKLDYFAADVRSQTEEAWIAQRSQLLAWKEKLSPPTSSDVKSAVASEPAAQRSHIERLKPPIFTGRYTDWPAFRDLFTSLVHNDPSLSDIERYQYLISSVSGEAQDLTRDLVSSGESFTRAWERLRGRYENERILVRAAYDNFLAVGKMKNSSLEEFRRIVRGILTAIDSLEAIGRPLTNEASLFIHLGVNLFDAELRREWERRALHPKKPATLNELTDFMESQLQTLELVKPIAQSNGSSRNNSNSASRKKSVPTKQVHHVNSNEKKRSAVSTCVRCASDQHKLQACPDYAAMSAIERECFVNSQKLCINCLGSHAISTCASKRTCFVCGSKHHTTLHDVIGASLNVNSPVHSTNIARCLSNGSDATLLATARGSVRDALGSLSPVRMLVDPGSNSTLVTEGLVTRLRLRRRGSSHHVIGVGGKTVSRGEVTLHITDRWGRDQLEVSALIVRELPVIATPHMTRATEAAHLRGLQLADPDFLRSDPCQILLSTRALGSIIGDRIKRGNEREPYAFETSLGWLITGAVDDDSSKQTFSVCHCTTGDTLDALVERFWRQEEVRDTRSPSTEEEQQCEKHFIDTYSRRHDGRYIVRLPVRDSLPDLSSSYHVALSRVRGVERRLMKDSAFREQYRTFMSEYALLGHMSLVPPSEVDPPGVIYLPHHGVLKQSADCSKVRVVFDGSAVCATGESINKHLLVGENLLPPLTDILTRWRCHRFVFVTDIEKMYRQVLVHDADRDLQRILWRVHPDTDIQRYRLNTVTYGLACAPFLAMRTLKQLAVDESSRFPAGSRALLEGVYVDDILAGASTIADAQHLMQQLIDVCKTGGMSLKKWASNDEELLHPIPLAHQQDGARSWNLRGCHSTLGVSWNPIQDNFTFSVRLDVNETSTKRSVLSQTARLFDPLGWLAPVIVRAKILIRRLWQLGLHWDESLPEPELTEWTRFLGELPLLHGIAIDRWLGMEPTTHSELHGFADASASAYAAVVYLRTTDAAGCTSVVLLTGKTRVAPTRGSTIPRLELCAAHLLTKLIFQLRTIDDFSELPVHLWSDSTVTLGWIAGHPSRWHVYVSNRVASIQEMLPDAVWRHLPGKDNPADCASRGLPPSELPVHPLWWHGPEWLLSPPSSWPADILPLTDVSLPESRGTLGACTVGTAEDPPLLTRFSTLSRLCRVTAWCLRWCRPRTVAADSTSDAQVTIPLEVGVGRVQEVTALSVAEIAAARAAWIRLVQASYYRREVAIARDRNGSTIDGRSSIFKLLPFLDDNGILRVGGRLRHSVLDAAQRHPIILPSESHLARLIIAASHETVLHGGVQATLSCLRQEYWLPRGRTAVKSYIHRCVRCVRWRAAFAAQRMADLPPARVTPSRPFLHTGIDYAGPYQVRMSGGRGVQSRKSFMCIFVCFASRAVHMELVSDYTSEAFLAALRRFIARRGLPTDIYSDQGTNFVGADKQLRRFFADLEREGRQPIEELRTLRVRWHFNPPASPHFGGLWEAAVKSAKHHLRRVIGNSTLTFEELSTLLAQVEACLNSRPLHALSDDSEDLSALTPGHFLVGAPLNSFPEPSMLDIATNRLQRWQIVQQMRDHFWQRWAEEYLTSLYRRPKWLSQNIDLRVGRLCLLRNELTSPGKWPLARIVALHPGDDGLVRVVSLKTASTELRRPVVKLILLPSEGEDQRAP